MKKQTAVDFFYWELIKRIDFTPMGGWDVINNILEQAKAMEKEQIEDAAGIGHFEGMGKAPMSSIEYFEYAANYYQYHYGQ